MSTSSSGPGSSDDGATPGAASSRFIDDDLFCIRCGYNLRALARDAACPECALPARASAALPAQFRLRTRKEANRLRWGLSLLVVSVLIATIGCITVTMESFLHLQLWNAGYGRPVVLLYRAWFLGEVIADGLRLAAIASIAWPANPTRSAGKAWNGWRVAVISLAAIGFAGHLLHFGPINAFRGGAAGQPLLGILAAAAVPACGVIALLLAWIIVAGSAHRRTRGLRIVGAIGALAAGIGGCAFGFYRYVAYALDWTTAPFSGFEPIVDEWAFAFLDASYWIQQHVGGACWIVMIAAAWVYLRRLNAVLKI